jgi:hypothetical protein
MPSENPNIKSSASSSMLRYVGVSAFAFLTGFYIHSLVMTTPPAVLTEQEQKMIDLQARFKQEAEKNNIEINLSTINTSFDGSGFIPSVVVVPIGRRINIINSSNDKLMKLISDNEDLTTPRGYANSERHLQQLYDRGIFFVYAEGVPDAKLEVRVE